jgi:hypothetical protein
LAEVDPEHLSVSDPPASSDHDVGHVVAGSPQHELVEQVGRGQRRGEIGVDELKVS